MIARLLVLALALAAAMHAAATVPIAGLAFHPNNKILAVGGYEEVLLWDLAEARMARRIGVGEIAGLVHALAFRKDGLLAVASNGVQLLDLASGRVAGTLGGSGEIFALAFSADGKLLAAGGTDGVVRIWNAGDCKLVTELKAHGDWITGLAFSPNGKLLASGSADRTVQVWDTAEWKSLVSLPQNITEPVSAVAFSPDGTTLALAIGGTEERAIRLWRPDVLEQQATPQRKPNYKFTRPYDTGSCMPLGVVWAGGARPRMAIACTDKMVRILNANGGVLANMSGHQDWVYGVAVNGDGSRFASGSGDGTVRLWNGADHTPLAVLMQLRPRTDEWLIRTPRGHFATSNPGAEEVQGKAGSELDNVQAVREALAGKPRRTP